jgi:hypothetical protein
MSAPERPAAPPTSAPEPARDALARARAFLEAQGARREARYVGALLGDTERETLRAEAQAGQDARGALAPLLAGDAPGPGVASTADALGWLVALGLTEGAGVDAAAAFLVREQEPDGGWSDAAARGGEERLALSAAVLGLLVRCPAARASALRRAAAHLAERWSVERVQGGSYAAIAGTLHALSGVPAEVDVADEALQWCGRELERGFRIGAFDALQVGRVFRLCEAAALPGARLGAAEVARALLAAQAPDGGFGAAPARERATCEACLALRLLGPALG